MLYAEYEFNASTFSARVITTTMSDIYSGITGVIGALDDHYTAGQTKQQWSIAEYKTPQEATQGILDELVKKERLWALDIVCMSRLTRNAVIKEWSKRFSENVGNTKGLYPISEVIER